MFRTIKHKIDYSSETYRKCKRYFDNISYRQYFIILLFLACLILYLGPAILRKLLKSQIPPKDPILRCMDDCLTPFYIQNSEYNVNIRHTPPLPFENGFLPYTGNGYIGMEINDDALLMIKYGRYLSLPVNFHPIVSIFNKIKNDGSGGSVPDAAAGDDDFGASKEATVTDYVNGLVNRYQCFSNGFFVAYEYYAYRNIPSVFVQEIKITNTKNQLIDIELKLQRITDWPTAVSQIINIQHGSTVLEYQVITGLIEIPNRHDQIIAISIVTRKLPRTIQLKKRGITKLDLLTVINYSNAMTNEEYSRRKDTIENDAIKIMKNLLNKLTPNDIVVGGGGGGNTNPSKNNDPLWYSFKREHTKIWNKLWLTGFRISSSKAEDSINGDRINATIYGVLSQARSLEFEDGAVAKLKWDIALAVQYSEGCYDSYHTLQADQLWRPMRTITEFNQLIAKWLLTLEKQGCHKLIKAGASGIIQSMVLSMGGLRFSNQHLELNIHPKYLHRDYLFRNINYGNMTYLNISISVKDDNKAVLYVSLDHTISNNLNNPNNNNGVGQYYACDAGCLDSPVPLGVTKRMFPVKLTEPLTAILYITSDKQHIDELQHAIHVKEVVEAPAHEHHVIALHKHGHSLGSLPTLFWVSVCVVIVVFHVFLIKLIVKEYCEPPDKLRYRYSKP